MCLKLKVPKLLPLDKYDGSFDEKNWEVAQGAAYVLLNRGSNHGSYGILGRPPEVQGHDPELWTMRDQQYRSGGSSR